jgi:hypothetical protein
MEEIANKLISVDHVYFERVRGVPVNTLQMINYNTVCMLQNITESDGC